MLNIISSAVLLSITIFVLTLLAATAYVFKKHTKLINIVGNGKNSQSHKPTKLNSFGKISVAFVFYLLIGPAEKARAIDGKLYTMNLAGRSSLMFSIILTVIYVLVYIYRSIAI